MKTGFDADRAMAEKVGRKFLEQMKQSMARDRLMPVVMISLAPVGRGQWRQKSAFLGGVPRAELVRFLETALADVRSQVPPQGGPLPF
jgi:hypothetical protein